MNPEILDRLPPQNLDAEKGVLGAILLDAATFDSVASIVGPEDFYSDANKRLCRTLYAMYEARERVDLLLLRERLREAGELECIGGSAYLAEVVGSVASIANVGQHAALVKRAAQFRAIIRTAERLLQTGHQAEGDPADAVAEAEKAIGAISTGDHRETLVHISTATREALEQIDKAAERQGHAGVLTGLRLFDERVGGLFPSELVILAARPGLGKTSLAAQVALHNGERERLVYFASLEMSAAQQTLRLLCGRAGVSSKLVRTGRVSPAQAGALGQEANGVAAASVWFDDRPTLKVNDIRRATLRLLKDGLSLVVVDYLQLLTPDDGRQNREQQVAKMVRALKGLARELDVPVLVLCQLNRAVETEKVSIPRLSNLRESGAIEQDADVVLFIHDPAGNPYSRADREVKLIVAKNRYGETGAFTFQWHPSQTLFTDTEAADLPNYEDAFDAFGG